MITVPRMARTPGSADFFDAVNRGALLLWRCDRCGLVRRPDEVVCRDCGSLAHTPIDSDGSATLVSWAVVHRAPMAALDADTPYVVGIVEAAEAPWFLARIETGANEALRVGAELTVAIAAADDGGEPLLFSERLRPVRAPPGTPG
jgi:uncharacterized OB-fold protein